MRTVEQRLVFLEDIIEKLAYEVYEIRRSHDSSTDEWSDTSDQTAYNIWAALNKQSRATFDDEE